MTDMNTIPGDRDAGERANVQLTPNELAPAPPTSSADEADGRGPDPVDAQLEAASAALINETDDGHGRFDAHPGSAVVEPEGRAEGGLTPRHVEPASPVTIDALRELQSRRTATMKAILRQDNATGALVRRRLGWSADLDAKQSDKLKKRAAALVAAVEKGTTPDAPEDVVRDVSPFILAAVAAREPFANLLRHTEREMEGLAKTLPVWPWVEAVRGFGPKGLASVVGEAGDLSDYANPGKLWKRMGLALVGTVRQGAPGPKATADDWIAHGYVGRRRAIVWNIGEALIKAQVRAEKDEDGERTGTSTAIGPYGALYLERKAYELARTTEMKPLHAHNRAKRYVEKRLLRDLWKAWRGARVAATPIHGPPPAEHREAA